MENTALLSAVTLNRNEFAFNLLQTANQIFLSTRRSQTVLTYLAREATDHLGVEGCLIWLQNRDKPAQLICRSAYHTWLDQFQVELPLKPGEGVAGQVFKTGQPMMIPEVTADIRVSPDINALGSGTVRNLLAIPIVSNHTLIGVFEFINKHEGPFTDQDQVLAETVTASAAVAISHACLVESLQQQVDDLQMRNEDLDAFAHSVAHDLQNPLSQVVGFAQLLQFKLNDLSDEERLYSVNALNSSATKMSSIIQELLLLASVRKTEVAVKPLQMERIVSNALRRLDRMITEAGAEIILPEIWPTVLGYAPWVEEIWENYLSNAVKYGGDPPRIEVGSAEEAYGIVRFWVRDNGDGFDLEIKNQLFVPVTQLRPRTSNQPQNGHGLGLSIVRRIVEKLGGKVEAACVKGEGSTFSFTLPKVTETGD